MPRLFCIQSTVETIWPFIWPIRTHTHGVPLARNCRTRTPLAEISVPPLLEATVRRRKRFKIVEDLKKFGTVTR